MRAAQLLATSSRLLPIFRIGTQQCPPAEPSSKAPAGHALPRPLRRAPPTGPEVRTRTGKMEAAAEPLRSVRLLSRVLLFLSQCYVLSGDGEFKVGGRSGQAGGTGSRGRPATDDWARQPSGPR